MTDSTGSEQAVTIERTFDAPVDVVWQMWTDPQHFARWYGPAGATVQVAEMDVRVGGPRRISMQLTTPDGPVRMWFTGAYREVVDNQRLVYTESICNENGDIIAASDMGMPPGSPATTEVRVGLEDLGGRTRMIITHIGVAAGSPGATGWAMAVDKLAIHLTAPG